MLNEENSYLFKFAWKSIRRNAGRSFFIGFSVSLAVVIAVWVVAFFDGFNYEVEKAVVNTNIGYFQIQEENYSRSTDSTYPLDFDQYASRFSHSEIKSISPELVLDGNISTPEGSAALTVLGIHPPLHQKFLPISENMTEGDFITTQDDNSVLIGRELANQFKFNIDDWIVLNYQDLKGELRSELLQIKGIFNYSSMSFENKYVYINQKTWQKLFIGEDKNRIMFNRISLMTDGLKVAPLIHDSVKNTNLVVQSWKNLNPEMAVVLDFHDGMIRFFFVIIGITITMTILNPVQMLWQERLKELKMLNIIGVSSNKFWKIGIFETIQMIVASGIFSVFILAIIIGIQSYTGIDFSAANQGLSIERAGIKLPRIVYPELTFTQIMITFGFVVMVLSISYIWSIHRTLKKLEVAP